MYNNNSSLLWLHTDLFFSIAEGTLRREDLSRFELGLPQVFIR